MDTAVSVFPDGVMFTLVANIWIGETTSTRLRLGVHKVAALRPQPGAAVSLAGLLVNSGELF